MENQLKSYFIQVLIPQKDFFFSKSGPKPLTRKRRKKHLRICSPSLALKIQISKKKVLVFSGANKSPSFLWPQLPRPLFWTQAGGVRASRSRRRVWWRPVLKPHVPDQRTTLLHFWYSSSSCVVSIPKCGMCLRDAARALTTKGIESKRCSFQTPDFNQTVTKPMLPSEPNERKATSKTLRIHPSPLLDSCYLSYIHVLVLWKRNPGQFLEVIWKGNGLWRALPDGIICQNPMELPLHFSSG